MNDAIYLPITEPEEIMSLARELPLAVNSEHFVQFVRGFPRGYLISTPRLEIVKHFLLAESMGKGNSISSLYRQEHFWKLALITRDRAFLFSRIAGALACFGVNITAAEAFINANHLVLDTFLITDPGGSLGNANDRARLQHVVDEAADGIRDIDQMVRDRWSEVPFSQYRHLEISFDNESHPSNTRLHLKCLDHVGLAYLLSDCISRCGHSIEMAYIITAGEYSQEDYYITSDHQKLCQEEQDELKEKLERLGGRG